MTNREAQFEDVKIRLGALRPLISGSEAASGYLTLFDELFREYEFALALETLCDFLCEAASRVDAALLVQIDDLHKLMNVEDKCVEKLSKIVSPKY